MKTNPEEDRKNQEDTSRPPLSNMRMDGPRMTAEEYVRDRLDNQLNYYNTKSSWNQKKYKKLKKIEIILAASIPVLITISQMPLFMDNGIGSVTKNAVALDGSMVATTVDLITLNTMLQIIAAAAGILLVILNKMLELDQYFETWKTYRATATELEQERIKYLARVAPYDDGDAFDDLVDNVEAILNKENSSWKERTKNKKDTFDKAQQALQEQASHIQEMSYERERQDLDRRRAGGGTVVQNKAAVKPKQKPVVDEYAQDADYDQPDAYDEGYDEDNEIG